MAKIIKVQRRGALGGEATCRHCKQRGGPTQVPYQLVWEKGIGSLCCTTCLERFRREGKILPGADSDAAPGI